MAFINMSVCAIAWLLLVKELHEKSGTSRWKAERGCCAMLEFDLRDDAESLIDNPYRAVDRMLHGRKRRQR